MSKKTREESNEAKALKQSLAQNIKRLRDEKGVSQEVLCHAVDIDRTYMSGIERAVRNPSLEVIADLARELGVEPSELLKKRGNG